MYTCMSAGEHDHLEDSETLNDDESWVSGNLLQLL